MNRSVLILGLIGALVAPSAHATWLKGCQANATANQLTPGGVVCHTPASADDDPGLLNIGECENVDVMFYDNITGDGSGDIDATATVYLCPVVATAALDTETERLTGCQPVTNGAMSTTVAELFGMGGFIMWVDIEAASAENQVVVRCSQPAGQ